MKKLLLIPACLFFSPAVACVFCNREVSEGIFTSTFYPNLLAVFSPFIALTTIVIVLAIISEQRYRARLASNSNLLSKAPLLTTAIILGIGIGGFIDGIVLHQILQWHEMLSNKIPATDYVGKSINMFWDGIFHGFCALVTLIGIFKMWRLLKREQINKSGKLLVAGLISGWGIFNIVEGILDHHILKLHNVVEVSPNHDSANFIFLGISVVLLFIGYFLYKKA